MEYTTYFSGEFEIKPPLTPEQTAYIQQFNQTRRVQRMSSKTAKRKDEIRKAVDLPVGTEGGYFVGEEGSYGQNSGQDVVNGNRPPKGQPGLWCQWTSHDGETLCWDEGVEFYDYSEWLDYLILHFFRLWGRTLNGEVAWDGEESGDLGRLVVTDNELDVQYGEVTYRSGLP
tara:strand:+ start:3967 stop:4482 length:516 start_codon:yes stop_codon:yes gene_type:complete